MFCFWSRILVIRASWQQRLTPRASIDSIVQLSSVRVFHMTREENIRALRLLMGIQQLSSFMDASMLWETSTGISDDVVFEACRYQPLGRKGSSQVVHKGLRIMYLKISVVLVLARKLQYHSFIPGSASGILHSTLLKALNEHREDPLNGRLPIWFGRNPRGPGTFRSFP